MQNYTGIVLCGGLSSRMGRDKATLVVDNKPMVDRVVNLLQAVCNQVLISSNNQNLHYLQLPIVPDEFPLIGPMGGIHACLKRSVNKYNIVMACDMPMVSGGLLNLLLRHIKNQDAVVPTIGNRAEPLYAIYKNSILPHIEECVHAESYSLKGLLSALDVTCVNAADFSAELMNINTPAEFQQYANK